MKVASIASMVLFLAVTPISAVAGQPADRGPPAVATAPGIACGAFIEDGQLYRTCAFETRADCQRWLAYERFHGREPATFEDQCEEELFGYAGTAQYNP